MAMKRASRTPVASVSASPEQEADLGTKRLVLPQLLRERHRTPVVLERLVPHRPEVLVVRPVRRSAGAG